MGNFAVEKSQFVVVNIYLYRELWYVIICKANQLNNFTLSDHIS